MHKLISIALLIIAATFGNISGYARETGHFIPRPVPDEKSVIEMVNILEQQLDLTREQKAKILELYQTHFAEVRQFFIDCFHPYIEETVYFYMLEDMKLEFENDVKRQLTSEQKQQYQQYLFLLNAYG